MKSTFTRASIILLFILLNFQMKDYPEITYPIRNFPGVKFAPKNTVLKKKTVGDKRIKQYANYSLVSSALSISTGHRHSCAVDSNRGVTCWGNNDYGQLGDGSTNQHLIPTDVQGLSSSMADISAGRRHTCALTESGGVKCWGNNDYGQLGDGTTNQHLTPIDVLGLSTDVIAIESGREHSCALFYGGGVKCWGYNYYGQLGDGTTNQHLIPVDVVGLGGYAIAISAGGWHTCALLAGGEVKCWGHNIYGQIGDGNTSFYRLVPVGVVGLDVATLAIATGMDHTCALTEEGGVKCWGNNEYGQLGVGTTDIAITIPWDVIGLGSGTSAITAGGWHTCALLIGDIVKCWGNNDYGQLGDNSNVTRLTPVSVFGLDSSITALAGGNIHTCALTTLGGVKCWGNNEWGQTGDGTTTNRYVPVGVIGFEGEQQLPDFTVAAIEFTQAIQDLDNSVPLVEGKRTYVRVHVRNQGYPSSALVTAKLCRLNDCRVPSNPRQGIRILANPDRGNLDHSFYFELPPGWLYGMLTLTAEVNPVGPSQVIESNTENNSMTRSNQYYSVSPIQIRLFGISYRTNPQGTLYQPRALDYDSIILWLKRAYPVAQVREIQSSRSVIGDYDHLPECTEVNSLLNLLWQFDRIRGRISDDVRYYGVVSDGGGFMVGCAADIPSRVASGPAGPPVVLPEPLFPWDSDGTYGDWYAGHELAHTYGRYHAGFCGANLYVRPYPYPDGVIGGPDPDLARYFGFDIESRAIYLPNSHDLMTYCDYIWISDFTYNGIRDYLTSHTVQEVSSFDVIGEGLLVQGILNYTEDTVEMDAFYRIPEITLPLLPLTGTHHIKLLGKDAVTLVDYPFTPGKNTDPIPGENIIGLIGEVVPWITGTQSIAVYSDTLELASIAVSPNTPAIDIISPYGGEIYSDTVVISWEASDADFDPLTYAIQYSADDGLTWQAVTVGITNTNVYTMDLSYIPGSDSALIRVLASDGVNTGIDEADNVFSVPKKAPNPLIISPEMGRKYSLEQTIILVGEGNDIEDGTLEDAALSWRSSISEELGTGRILDVTGLPPGEHIITLTVTDSDGYQKSAEISIYIGERVYLPVLQR